jgi:hypothetical protein
MSDEQKEYTTTQPVILIGVDPIKVPEVDKVVLKRIDSSGLVHSERHSSSNSVSLQLVNNELHIILKG